MKTSLLRVIGMIVILFPHIARGVVVAGNDRFYEESQIHRLKAPLNGTFLSEGGLSFTITTSDDDFYCISPTIAGDSWINSIKFKCVLFSYDGKLWADLFMEGGEIKSGIDLSADEIELAKSGVHYLVRFALDKNQAGVSSAVDTLIAKLPKEGIRLEKGVVIVNVKTLKPARAMKELFGFFQEPVMLFKKWYDPE
jgi:hypothetical protein